MDEVEITRDSVWMMRDGRGIEIKHMDDKHLLNTIRCLRNMSPIGTKIKMTDQRRRQFVNAMANEAYARNLTIDALSEEEPIHE